MISPAYDITDFLLFKEQFSLQYVYHLVPQESLAN
jgi:hypothetical protein